ncbi:hypothetical protein [Candidatus Enterovibrio escicola]|uniref:hypothetical protein n=1 Tax=Candidatus Enterovibrio escicola TaxID=1927127 RepID=UPI001CC24594
MDYMKGTPSIDIIRYDCEEKRYQENLDQLIKFMESATDDKFNVRFYCVLDFMCFSNDPTPVGYHRSL